MLENREMAHHPANFTIVTSKPVYSLYVQRRVQSQVTPASLECQQHAARCRSHHYPSDTIHTHTHTHMMTLPGNVSFKFYNQWYDSLVKQSNTQHLHH